MYFGALGEEEDPGDESKQGKEFDSILDGSNRIPKWSQIRCIHFRSKHTSDRSGRRSYTSKTYHNIPGFSKDQPGKNKTTAAAISPPDQDTNLPEAAALAAAAVTTL